MPCQTGRAGGRTDDRRAVGGSASGTGRGFPELKKIHGIGRRACKRGRLPRRVNHPAPAAGNQASCRAGGARPRTDPPRAWSGACWRWASRQSRCHVRFVGRPASEAWDARSTGSLETRDGVCASSVSWDRLAVSGASVFRERAWFGTSAFNPTKATSVMTHGINTVR